MLLCEAKQRLTTFDIFCIAQCLQFTGLTVRPLRASSPSTSSTPTRIFSFQKITYRPRRPLRLLVPHHRPPQLSHPPRRLSHRRRSRSKLNDLRRLDRSSSHPSQGSLEASLNHSFADYSLTYRRFNRASKKPDRHTANIILPPYGNKKAGERLSPSTKECPRGSRRPSAIKERRRPHVRRKINKPVLCKPCNKVLPSDDHYKIHKETTAHKNKADFTPKLAQLATTNSSSPNRTGRGTLTVRDIETTFS